MMSTRRSLVLEGPDDASIAQLDDFEEEFYGTGSTCESGEESHVSSSDDEPAAKKIRYRTPYRPSGITATSRESGAESDDDEESDRDSELEYSASGEGAS